MDFFGCVDSLVRLNTRLELKIVFIGRQDYELDSLPWHWSRTQGFYSLSFGDLNQTRVCTEFPDQVRSLVLLCH